MAKITAAEAVVRCLSLEGVRHIFGYPGAAICPFYDALERFNAAGAHQIPGVDGSPPHKISHILVRHEANAGHAANGYARVTGKPSVCVATSGPGATNLITAIATAYMDSVPLVVITGQVPRGDIGRDVFQEADITGAAEPFVKHSYLVNSSYDAEDVPELLRNAFYIAGSGRPGPVLVDIPLDVLKTVINFRQKEYRLFKESELLTGRSTVEMRGYHPSFEGHAGQLKRAARAVKLSERPLIVAGGGLFGTCSACAEKPAKELMRELAEKADIPVITTLMGLSGLGYNHRLNYGMLGMHGDDPANYALNECDLMLVLGARLGDRAIMKLRAPGRHDRDFKLIHADIDPAEIGKVLQIPTIPIVGDLSEVLRELISLVQPAAHTEWREHLNEQRSKSVNSKSLEEYPALVNPKAFIKMLSGKLYELEKQSPVIVADVGQNQMWTAKNIELDEKGRFMTSGGMGTMGYSVPAAIGAKTAFPDSTVVALCGDGSFQMQFMELATMVQHGINVKIIVFVNRRLGMVRELQTNLYKNKQTAVFLDGSPDFVKLTNAYGINAESVSSLSEADEALTRMLTAAEPYLLQVFVPEETKTLL